MLQTVRNYQRVHEIPMIGEILNIHDHYALPVSSSVMVPPSTIAFSWGPHNSKNSLWFIDVYR